MSAATQVVGDARQDSPLRDAFMRWQCRVRQIAMRENSGQPDDAITPAVFLPSSAEPLGHIITVLCKTPAYSKTPELHHIFKRTNEPAQRREMALRFFSETHYQKHREFSDMVTATFLPDSSMAEALIDAGSCRLVFDAYGQRFELGCSVTRLQPSHPSHQATKSHNLLFNPNFSPDTVVLGFDPNWASSSADPEISGSGSVKVN